MGRDTNTVFFFVACLQLKTKLHLVYVLLFVVLWSQRSVHAIVEVWPCSQNFWSRQTYHFWTPHSLINRVKSPLWMQTGSILYLSPLCVDGSSWCPFSVSQVIGYENVRLVSHKKLLVFWSVQLQEFSVKFSLATASGFPGSTEFSCSMAGNHDQKRNSNLSPNEASSNPHCFCYCRRADNNTIIAYIVCCGNFVLFTHPPLPEVWPCSQNFWSRKTYHIRTPHSLINRVKSPRWMQTGSIRYSSPLCVVLLLSPLP